MTKLRLLSCVGVLVFCVIAAAAIWIINYLFWFGGPLPDIDRRQAMLELQAECAGVAADDFRAYDLLVGLQDDLERVSEAAKEPPRSAFHAYWSNPENEPELVENWLEACRSAGVLDAIEELAGFDGCVARWSEQTLMDSDYIDCKTIGILSRIQFVLTKQLLHEADSEGVIWSIEKQLSLANLLLPQPGFLPALVGIDQLTLSIKATQNALRSGVLKPENVDRLIELYDAVELPDTDRIFEGELLVCVDFLSKDIGDDKTLRAASAAAQADYITKFYGQLAEFSRLDYRERAQFRIKEPEDDWRYEPALLLYPSVRGLNSGMDRIKIELDGIRIMLALESYRLKTGVHPESLEILVPEHLNELPMDRFAIPTSPYTFRKLSSNEEPVTSYVLYCVGRDGIDNGGISPDQYPEGAFAPGFPGTDYVINRID